MRRHPFMLVPVLLGLLALPALAALVAEVRDEAGFFKPEAIAKANQVIKSIKDQSKHDLLIETFKTIPAARADEFQKLDKAGKEKFYADWAVSRARAAEVNGVYVLISKEPGHIETAIGNETKKKAFTLANRQRLNEILLDKFRKADGLKDAAEQQKLYDQALLDAVNYVHNTMRVNLGECTSADPAADDRGERQGSISWGVGGWLCIGLVAVLAIWVVLGLVRGGGGGWGGGGGGGFMSSLLGGMFGAAAGMWLYDSFFRGGGSSAYGADPGASAGPQDTDYSSGGGDFGGDAGGGGGGGDFGGGGGDFGGGGGDF